ncbi:MAG TPA: YdcF family protein [Candidatus Methylomirabilis sp.]|nr:YdcF family protein [Candidatus Methylomirabilis sp.]
MRLIWRIGRLLVLIIILGVGLYVGSPFLLGVVGRYLVTEQPLAKADLILVLSGQVLLRIPEGARLYHEGYASKILLTNEPKERGWEDLLRVGIRVPDSQQRALTLLEELRVPRRDILLIQEQGNTTQSEMQTVVRFLKSHPVRSVIIVTSKSHTTRAYKIFSSGLEPGIRLIMHPVPNDPFDPSRWWRDRTDAKAVLNEYGALADFWRSQLWKSMMGDSGMPPHPIVVR